jgi:hypothetical protein
MLKCRWYQLVSLVSVAAVLGSGCGDQGQRASTKDANASDRSSSSSAAEQSPDEEAAIRSVAKHVFEFGPGFVPAVQLIEDRAGARAAFSNLTKLPMQNVAWELKSLQMHERIAGLASAEVSISSNAPQETSAAGAEDLAFADRILSELRAIRFRDVLFSEVDGTWQLTADSACAIVYQAVSAAPMVLEPCTSEPLPPKGFDSGPTKTFTDVPDVALPTRSGIWAVHAARRGAVGGGEPCRPQRNSGRSVGRMVVTFAIR